jgi:hypothetical protein
MNRVGHEIVCSCGRRSTRIFQNPIEPFCQSDEPLPPRRAASAMTSSMICSTSSTGPGIREERTNRPTPSLVRSISDGNVSFSNGSFAVSHSS